MHEYTMVDKGVNRVAQMRWSMHCFRVYVFSLTKHDKKRFYFDIYMRFVRQSGKTQQKFRLTFLFVIHCKHKHNKTSLWLLVYITFVNLSTIGNYSLLILYFPLIRFNFLFPLFEPNITLFIEVLSFHFLHPNHEIGIVWVIKINGLQECDRHDAGDVGYRHGVARDEFALR